ncbi:hypothetical protein COU62_02975 [Candidatus Pacearchaeota archaeon CG10_big_fil_rev_8_21_14_0_10_35_219]|nr:hypothetical protein [Candidatus Pacearchaeota archaeon]OIO42622.1 MAG: hypothetical protein AUJ63_02430 [Candidatus Pacearchaeota archaeon CG1_02_35_32]PIO07592.1 MAG: hypothetical protein COU62_02975 [Candidatus Pacearchaeota archaeon CG10_big_fil_rev_8_21_14_0_10_35_219]PIY81928.1 MAG: hypothetical protein COY79_00135 [Candidatus Pacearchaeota archaeon CG_4_10_14_0_8_um_filter_35_169]PIZ80581.1 MAG: hypothetical protein COY00_00950 [Candidatus Pacearchaeota archaeon CG_4_10_14_0_2_um_filt
MKVLILDAGPVINLSINGLLELFEKLSQLGDIKIVITEQVRKEIIDKPLGIPRFELGAIRAEKLMENKILILPESLGISKKEINAKTKEIQSRINNTFKAENKFINIVSEAESSCLALSLILTEKKIENIIAIDERTTRMLFEKPENLESLMSKKLHKRVYLANQDFRNIGKFRFIRSPELVYVAYKKGLTELKSKKALEALLYATKFKGSSVSYEEIKQIKKM